MENWDAIESDFQREYNIDLITYISTMSWRRFVVLLRGLSGESRWYQLNDVGVEDSGIIEDPTLAERAVDRIWK